MRELTKLTSQEQIEFRQNEHYKLFENLKNQQATLLHVVLDENDEMFEEHYDPDMDILFGNYGF